jgi:replicative DNA helicase
MRGVPTGIQDLDSFTDGLQGADLAIIATLSSGSQVSLAMSIALQVATTTKYGVGLFSLARNKHHVVQQLLAMRTGIDLHRLRVGWITDEEHTLVSAAAKRLSKAHLWIDDTVDLSLVQLRQRARQLVEMHPLALVMVDDLYLIEPGVQGKRDENLLQEPGEIHRSLKALAAELNLPVVVFAPIACAVAGRHAKSPRRSDQGESAPEKAIDHVLFLYRDELSAPRSESTHIVLGRMMITKHHNGLVTELDISIQPRQARFRDLEQGGKAVS